MADNQKYYYMRLKEGFFDNDNMLLLESMPDGYLYSNILLKLYLRSLKDNGRLMLNGRIPYNSQMIATVTRHQVGTIEKALQIFMELGLIEVLDNGAIYMMDIQTYIGKSSTEADRKREYRERLAQEKILLELPQGQTADKCPDKSTPEIEIEKEIEIELEIEGEIELKTPPSDGGKPPASAPIPYSQIRDLYHKLCPSYPKLRSISDNRKKAIAARWREYNGDIAVFEKLFSLAEASAFLKGKNGRDWSADFDWLMKSGNMAKVLEYKYNDSKPQMVYETPKPEVVKLSPEEAAAAKRELDARLAAIRAGRGGTT